MAAFSAAWFFRCENLMKSVCSRLFVNKQQFQGLIGVRYYLSPSYECKDSWEARFQSPLLQKLNMVDLFMEIDKRFTNKKKVGAVDIDMFANNIREQDQLEELQSILHRFRKTPFTINMLDSTPHAVIRSFMQYKQYDALLEILNDRIEYGIFPDYYCYNLLMDTFLVEKNYKDAASVATLMMLQEDFGHPISRLLALNACHMHLRNPPPEPTATEENEDAPQEEDDEEVFVRVPMLRNPYFDDHFDIKNPKHLLGKTLYMVGKEFDDPVGRTYQIIGLGMYEKWEKASKIIEKFADSGNQHIIKEGVDSFLNLMTSCPEESPVSDPVKRSIEANIEKLKSQNLIIDEDLHTLVMKKMDQIKELEKSDIELQKEVYKQWEVNRQEALKNQIEEYFQEERKKQIEAKKAELEEKEKLLFFFENWDKHEMELAEAEKKIAELKPELVEESYVPPDVRKPHITSS